MLNLRAVRGGALLGVTVALLWLGYAIGHTFAENAAKARELVYLKAHQKTLEEAFQDYQAKLLEQKNKDKKVIDGYITEMASIDRRYRELARTDRLRLPRSVCDPDPVPTGYSGEPRLAEGVAPTVVLPERVEADLRDLARRADEVTAQCRAIIAGDSES